MPVADDHPAVLEAVAEFLVESGIEVVGRAVDGEEALAHIERLRPDRFGRRPDAEAQRNRAARRARARRPERQSCSTPATATGLS